MGKSRLRGLQGHFHLRRPPHSAACRLASPTPLQSSQAPRHPPSPLRTLFPCFSEHPPPAKFASGMQSTLKLRIPCPSAFGSFCGFAASAVHPHLGSALSSCSLRACRLPDTPDLSCLRGKHPPSSARAQEHPHLFNQETPPPRSAP